MEKVIPFKLTDGCYVETIDGSLIGPISHDGGVLYFFDTANGRMAWSSNGFPYSRTPRIKTVILGPTGMNAFIDRTLPSAIRGNAVSLRQLEAAKKALRDMLTRARDSEAAQPIVATEEHIGAASDRALRNLLRDVIREELRAAIREEMPVIIAENSNPFDGSEMRLAVTLSPLRS